jgi:hypothetical protein
VATWLTSYCEPWPPPPLYSTVRRGPTNHGSVGRPRPGREIEPDSAFGPDRCGDRTNSSSIPIGKKKKQSALRELMRALQIRGKLSVDLF